MVESLKFFENMFTLGRKFDVAKTLCVRPISFYSTKSLSGFNQLDILNKGEQHKNTVPEQIEDTLKSALDPLQVLSSLPSTSTDFKALSGDTVISALRTIAILQKSNTDIMKQHFITSHPKFELLCRRLKICSSMFTPDELINSLKFLSSLGVPKNSEISLVLMNLIRHEINHLNIKQIIYLVFILNQTESCSELEKIMKTALPVTFDQQILQQVDVNNSVSDLVKILNFMGSHRDRYIRDRNVKRVCRLLADKKEEIELSDAVNIIHHLCALNRFEVGNTIRLMNICIKQLLKRIYELDIKELLLVIQKLVTLAVNQFLSFQYFIHGLLGCCGRRIAEENLGLEIAVDLQTSCKKISYRNNALLEYIGDQIASNIDYCRTMELQTLFTIVQAFANNVYEFTDKDIWSTQVVPAIINNENLINVPSTSRTWMHFTLQLMVLEHYNQKLITRVLSSPYLDTYLNNDNLTLLDLHKVLILYQTAAMQPGIDVNCVKQKVINEVFEKYAKKISSCEVQDLLMQEIRNGFAISNIRTKYSHLIQTLVKINKSTMDFEHFPGDLPRDENGFVSLDDVPQSKDELLICVDVIKRHTLFSNISRAKCATIHNENKIGIFRLRSEQLKNLGVAVCEINYRRYKHLDDTQKLQYLRESILNIARNLV